MFETKRTLIVVYKDELLMNQLRKMVETRDDEGDEVIGARDDSVNIVSWTEKVWLANKEAGNIQGKILFLGDVKGTEKLIPVVGVEFDEYGVKYGWAGNQAVLFAEPKALDHDEDYQAFLQKLSEYPVPDSLIPEEADDETSYNKILNMIIDTKEKLPSGAARFLDKTGEIINKSGSAIKKMATIKRQMLFYGLINFYYNGLEIFLDS